MWWSEEVFWVEACSSGFEAIGPFAVATHDSASWSDFEGFADAVAEVSAA
jgi:hypothetical protein